MELQNLEEHGITIKVNNKIYTIYFILSLLLGDNLVLNSML